MIDTPSITDAHRHVRIPLLGESMFIGLRVNPRWSAVDPVDLRLTPTSLVALLLLVRQASSKDPRCIDKHFHIGEPLKSFFYWKTFYLVVATDCKRYLTGPKDLLNNYTDPMGQLDNYADSKASKNQRSSKWPLIFSSEYWLFRPTKISIYLARPEEPVNNIFWSVVQHDMLWPVTTTKSNIP